MHRCAEKMIAASVKLLLLFLLLSQPAFSKSCDLPLPLAKQISALIGCVEECEVTRLHYTCLAVASRDRYSQVSLAANISNATTSRATRVQLSCSNSSWMLESNQSLTDGAVFSVPTRRDCVDCKSKDTPSNCTRK